MTYRETAAVEETKESIENWLRDLALILSPQEVVEYVEGIAAHMRQELEEGM